MPKLHHVKKANKDNPAVKKGEEYWWWKNAWGPRKYSKTCPKPSQLYGSAFLREFYSIKENFEESHFETRSELYSKVDSLRDDFERLRDESQESLDNMPEHLQETSTGGIILTERIEALGSAIDEVDSLLVILDDQPDPEPERELDDIMSQVLSTFPEL